MSVNIDGSRDTRTYEPTLSVNKRKSIAVLYVGYDTWGWQSTRRVDRETSETAVHDSCIWYAVKWCRDALLQLPPETVTHITYIMLITDITDTGLSSSNVTSKPNFSQAYSRKLFTFALMDVAWMTLYKWLYTIVLYCMELRPIRP